MQAVHFTGRKKGGRLGNKSPYYWQQIRDEYKLWGASNFYLTKFGVEREIIEAGGEALKEYACPVWATNSVCVIGREPPFQPLSSMRGWNIGYFIVVGRVKDIVQFILSNQDKMIPAYKIERVAGGEVVKVSAVGHRCYIWNWHYDMFQGEYHSPSYFVFGVDYYVGEGKSYRDAGCFEKHPVVCVKDGGELVGVVGSLDTLSYNKTWWTEVVV